MRVVVASRSGEVMAASGGKRQIVTYYFNVLMWYCECQNSTLDGCRNQRFRVDYDAEADVLYVSLERPQKVTDSGDYG